MPHTSRTGHPETLKNLLAEMSLKLVPNIVAKHTTTETPDAKKLIVLPYSVSSPRLCAHTNTMQAMGLSERGRDKLARGLSTCISKSHLPSRTRGRQMVEYEEDAVQLAGTPKRGCLGKYSLSCLIVGVDDLADARAPCKVRRRAHTQRSGCERTRAISEQAQFQIARVKQKVRSPRERATSRGSPFDHDSFKWWFQIAQVCVWWILTFETTT
jgi:hypothetical protein